MIEQTRKTGNFYELRWLIFTGLVTNVHCDLQLQQCQVENHRHHQNLNLNPLEGCTTDDAGKMEGIAYVFNGRWFCGGCLWSGLSKVTVGERCSAEEVTQFFHYISLRWALQEINTSVWLVIFEWCNLNHMLWQFMMYINNRQFHYSALKTSSSYLWQPIFSKILSLSDS